MFYVHRKCKGILVMFIINELVLVIILSYFYIRFYKCGKGRRSVGFKCKGFKE